VIINELDPADYQEISVHDGELNKMTFNHIKTSKAFAIVEPESYDDLEWLNDSEISTTTDGS